MNRHVTKLAALLPLGFATPAMAHPGPDLGTGFVAGFVHPFTGMDHLTAMVAVGLWSARAYPARIWALPAAFMSAMAAGFLVGHTGLAMPAETIILLSMPMLAAGAILAPRMNLGIAASITAFFALAHGYAHATEASGSHWSFAIAMLVATAILHVAGIALGKAVTRRPAAETSRTAPR